MCEVFHLVASLTLILQVILERTSVNVVAFLSLSQ